MNTTAAAARVRRAKIAGEILCDIGINNVGSTPGAKRCLTTVRNTLQSLAGDPNLPVVKRSEAASAFGWLEKLPVGIGLADGAPLRPLFRWCGACGEFAQADAASYKEKLFPAHTAKKKKDGHVFLIGEPADRPEKERAYGSFVQFPCTRITAPFFISKFPVTVAQYQAFIDARGYDREFADENETHRIWTKAGWKWREANGVDAPAPSSTAFQTPNHPRVGVSWYEARAFCAWLDSAEIKPHLLSDWGLPKDGWTIRLPSEAEWELAARWDVNAQRADDRRVPWAGTGDEADLSANCNWKGTGIGSTGAVGLFPSGDGDCAAADMVGNVWEWCATKWARSGGEWKEADYNKMNNGIDDDAGDDNRVLRGGSWFDLDPRFLRSAYRDCSGVGPDARVDGFGFRVVCVLGGSAGG